MKTLTSLLRIVWLLLVIGVVAALLLPVSAKLIRLFLCFSIPLALLGATLMLWKISWLRWMPLAPILLALLLIALPSREIDVVSQRDEYCRRLVAYENVRYLWGGESHQGIDCSGLVRQALREANLTRGLASLNYALLRSAFDLWLTDFPAKALIVENNHLAQTLMTAGSINSLSPDALEQGDLAVTQDGVHVLAYLGAGEWIEADPGVGRVIRVTTPAADNVWFEKPVVLVRWKVLGGG